MLNDNPSHSTCSLIIMRVFDEIKVYNKAGSHCITHIDAHYKLREVSLYPNVLYVLNVWWAYKLCNWYTYNAIKRVRIRADLSNPYGEIFLSHTDVSQSADGGSFIKRRVHCKSSAPREGGGATSIQKTHICLECSQKILP